MEINTSNPNWNTLLFDAAVKWLSIEGTPIKGWNYGGVPYSTFKNQRHRKSLVVTNTQRQIAKVIGVTLTQGVPIGMTIADDKATASIVTSDGVQYLVSELLDGSLEVKRADGKPLLIEVINHGVIALKNVN